jgi:hypothetical protein
LTRASLGKEGAVTDTEIVDLLARAVERSDALGKRVGKATPCFFKMQEWRTLKQAVRERRTS